MDLSELSERKLFVKQTRDDINSIKEHLNSPQALTRVENSTRQVFRFIDIVIIDYSIMILEGCFCMSGKLTITITAHLKYSNTKNF